MRIRGIIMIELYVDNDDWPQTIYAGRRPPRPELQTEAKAIVDMTDVGWARKDLGNRFRVFGGTPFPVSGGVG